MIVLHCFAKPLRNGNINAKNYPYWNELINELKNDYQLVQIGCSGEKQLIEDFRVDLSFKELKNLACECKSWIAIDSFWQHLAAYVGKPGVCLFGISDPNIFGHNENLNLLKDKKYLRKDQFNTWENVSYNKDVFLDYKIVANNFKNFIKTRS